MIKMWQEGGEAPFDDLTNDLKGDDIQKLSVIQTLPSLLAGDPQTCIQRLMPKMQQTLPTASTEFHVAASSTFKTILEQRLVSHSTFTETFLQSILNSLDSRDQNVAHAWLETLLDVIELLPTEVIRLDILPTAVNKGQLSQPVNSRIICCKLIGKICTRFDSQLIKKDILPTVHSLCQDVNSDVRACVCLQLRYVAEGLGSESVKSALLPSIVELASDEESNVRHASVQTIVYLLPHLQPDVIKSTISPLIKKSCDIALVSDDTVMCIIAQEFGKLAIGLEKCLSASEKIWLLKYFQQLSQVGIPSIKKDNNTKQEFPYTSSNPLMNERYVECRQLCAFNIPAMFLFASNSPDDIEILLSTFTDLAGDPFYMVRRTIASGIHEVAKILGPKNTLIKNDFIKLLKDDNEEVLQGLIPHVAQMLELLVQSHGIGTEQIDSSVIELGRALLKCEGEILNTNNWRLSASIFEQFEILPKCFPSDYIYTYFTPLSISRALNARPMPVRLAAGKTFLVFIRYNIKSTQRTEMLNRLYTEFSRSSNSYIRMIFIRMMIEAMTMYSSMYFKEHFFTTVLSLTEDPIANIRLKVVTLLPALKSYLRLPSDKKLLSSFESSVRNLMNNEKDRDVIFSLTNAIRKLDEIDVRHEGQTIASSGKFSKLDHEDAKKYEEEKKILAAMSGKSISLGQTTSIKKSTISSKSNSNDSTSSRAKQNLTLPDSLSSSVSSTTQKVKQVGGVPLSVTDNTFKASRQTAGMSRNFDISKARYVKLNININIKSKIILCILKYS
ncbi:hypothetical protein PV328_005690 [Microctonus aethiopoides]|uniref:Phosphatase PP2A regulatory subunit A/Splicing factor 3B subunit 1-like HEAT repeat domain-containing protein n=1 Tax=Microctonus aethiopoides TaxID=144406 RepID=A0AA39KSR9_9HYME|nr:hypothetical protein PV328_005690 [Microctonus aethiopoides]